MELEGQIALVTGASSGLGRRFATVLAGAGAAVAVAGRRLDRLTELVAEIEAAGGRALPVRLDMADAAALAGAVDVNISSMAAHDYRHDGAAGLYSVSKAAIERMTEVHAVEWARYRINVNAIAPGAFLTEMMEGMIGRLGTSEQELAERWPRGRFPSPELMDSTLRYLVSPASDAVTGTIVKIDDGQHGR
ncbi:SDR family oxidoreductase [Pseudonocardia oroxyli]|uniref:Short chain dehydrogenase n=1 Tax=Pseudonocardia oroxyli TaxID=366584 RepID=A0A1G7E120_PSEOR|nr:SDR family oxidoreductase [Pseudonocardia oroxyli]SDE57408.1 short chain dehydrogenase [Pseudonocardia oroxyli]